jgi:glycosyltransferase involved in cell wall biosynthesis
MKIGYVMQEGGPDVRQKPLTGPANHVLKVYQELQARGHEMTFLARYQGRLWRSQDLEHFEPVTVPKVDRGWRRMLERLVRGVQSRLHLPYANLFESLRFAEACRQELGDCDLIFERLGWMSYGAGLAAHSLNKPLVLEINNGDFVTELARLGVAPRGFQYNLAVWLMRKAVHRADFSVATGDGHRRRYIEWWGVDPALVATVENGSDVVNLLAREQLRCYAPVNTPGSPVVIVFVGAFEPWHGIPVLLPAFVKALQRCPQLRLQLIGSGTLQQEIERKIVELGIQGQVELTGQLNIRAVADSLAKADIGVAPYCGWMEFSGLKLFDYKSAGLPSVASGQNGEPATLEQDVTALIVPPCDEQALADALVRLAGDEGLRRSMGRAARLDAENRHSWAHTAGELEKIFLSVVRSQHA